jgi:hypothetical protein
MEWFWNLNLIHFFSFYLWAFFLVGTLVRIRQYEAIVRLVRAVPERWPRLLKLVKEHHAVFLTWSTLLPAVLALGLSVIHTAACRWIWPHANLTVSDLSDLHWGLLFIVTCGTAMLGVDTYGTFQVGDIDRAMLEKYFDQAEYWLRSWVAPVVHVFTLGYISPRSMVRVEVQKALVEASRLLNATLWWVIMQVSLRLVFGLVLWLTYAASDQ